LVFELHELVSKFMCRMVGPLSEAKSLLERVL